MKPSAPLTCLALAIGLAGPASGSTSVPLPTDLEPVERTCVTPPPSARDLMRVQQIRRRFAEEQPLTKLQAGGTIRVAFHVLTSGKVGNVSDEQVTAQIAELNRAYAGTGFSFELQSIDRTDHGGWARMNIASGAERHAKETLAVDPAHTLNIYTAALGNRLLGWAYLPYGIPEDHYLNGVVVHYGSLPGGPFLYYSLGRTLVHEVGHYLGLLHTFQNGCEAPGDLVDDTAYEDGPAFGCPEGRNSCPDPELDPIHNYMDYGYDACTTEFTPGQIDLMHDAVTAYRPSLFARGIARGEAEIAEDAVHPDDLAGGIEFRGAGPNPFRLATAVRFTLPRADRVQLQVFNVAGQRVRSLIDAQMPAGAHSAMFAAQDLTAGVYFVRLRVGRTEMKRSVILLK
ncbi:MAG TPA: M43 family zinc metalloprotease [Candidatus Eisenbacteria bacterium]|nr:M43 family zinc metalloprotease [Candidatus Eisenbacteria bacterium]